MRPPISSRWTVFLLLPALMGALIVTPAPVSASGRDRGILRNAASMPVADSIAQRTLESVVVRKPDGRIRWGAHGYPGSDRVTNLPFVGNNLYNTTGVGQKAIVENFNEFAGSYYTFDISIQNDGNRIDKFRSGSGPLGKRSVPRRSGTTAAPPTSRRR